MGVVDIALSQEGTKEATGNNDVKYNDWYYGHHVSGGKYPWCAVFVSWCCDQAGCLNAIGGKTASVSTLYDYFRGKGLFQPKGNGYRPKAGDILIQKSGGASHTGFVYASDANKFYTIEGNTSNKVGKREYSYNDSKLTGFGTPNYSGSAMTGSVPAGDFDNTGSGGSAAGQSLGVGEYDYTNYTVKSGDSIQSIAAKYNCTPAMIMFLNNLTSPNLKAGQKIIIPTASGALSTKQATSGVGTITKKHTMGVSVSHPTIEAIFYTESGMLSTVSTTGLTKDTDFDNDIISVSTIRDMGQDCPTFSISLVYRNNWYQNLSSNDLVIIKMQRPPESKAAVFFGLIDDIRKTLDFSSGQPQRAVQVTGRGFNKALVNFDVGLIENVSIDTGTGFFANMTQLSTCDSYDAIKLVLDSYIGKSVKYSFANGKSFSDYFTYSGNHHDFELLTDYTSYTSYNGSLWNFIKEISNTPFNESFWEIKNGKPNLIHRRTPFNKSDWIKLNRTTIKDLDIVSDSTGRSDLETYTLYSVNQSLGDETLTNMYLPLWYPPFYAKYGITQLQVSTIYQVWGEGNEENGIKSYYEDLFNFNIKNNIFSNGTLVVKGKANYRVGERVILESENMEYYVESVTQNFNCYGTWTTTLGITRGIEPEKRFTPPWGCAEELTPAMMNAIISQTSGEKIDWSNLPEVTYPSGGGGDGSAAYDPSSGGSVNGNTITLPAGLGNVWTYMGWQCITSPSSAQYKLRQQAGQNFDKDGFGIIKGRYVIACTTTYGKVGDYLTAYLSNGKTISCIIGDIKSQGDAGCNKWGHQNGKSVLEFVVNKSTWYGTSRTVLKYHPEWKNATVTKIVNTGNYWG